MTPQEFTRTMTLYSDDPDTQTAAAIFRGDLIVAASANVMPANVKWSEERTNRPMKYKFIEHAERAAIFSAAKYGKSLQGCHMETSMFPCAECARAIAMSGITSIRVHSHHDDSSRYGYEEAEAILREAGVEIL